MTRKATSMRGEIVDFDLLTIKSQMANTPRDDTTRQREKFINLKRRRGTKRKLQDMLAEQEDKENKEAKAAEEAKPVEEAAVEEAPVRRKIKKKEAE